MDGQALESLLSRDEDDSAMEALRDHKSRKTSDGSCRPWTASSNPFADDRRPSTTASEYSTPPFSHSPLPTSALPYPSPVHSSSAFSQNSHVAQIPYLSYAAQDRLDGMGIIASHFEAKRLNSAYILPHALKPNQMQIEFSHGEHSFLDQSFITDSFLFQKQRLID